MRVTARLTRSVSAKEHTTPEVAAAVGVSDQTIRRWARSGLLPAPRLVHRGGRGSGMMWPELTIAQGRWVHAQLEAGRTLDDVREALAAGEFTPGK